jgi:hypothetical protein
MANATTINWSELDRKSLYSYFYSLNTQLVGKNLTANQLHGAISRHIKQLLPIKVKRCMDPKIQKTYIYTGGVYYSALDAEGKKAIEINFSYHPNDKNYKITKYRWKKMSIRFADTVLHEMIHMRQFRARNFKSLPGYQSTAESAKDRKEQQYYGDRDEMGAFAFNIACELIDRFGYDPSAIKTYLDSNNRKRKNLWWYNYLKYFNWDHDHDIIRRMKRKIMLQLENAYYGKPFKTNNWLLY